MPQSPVLKMGSTTAGSEEPVPLTLLPYSHLLVIVHDDTYVGELIAFLRIEIADAHPIFRDMETGEHDHVHIHLCNILFTLQS